MCGSGSLLLKAAKILGKDNVRQGFYGQEINLTTYNLCRINMFLHDVDYDKFDIAHEDTLLSPQHGDDEPFEVIVLKMRGYETMIKVLFICHGNICRSTMAEFVFKDMVEKAGMAEQFYVESAATSREEIGNDTDPRTKRKLDEYGIPYTKRAARQMTAADYEKFDYIIGMDDANVSNIMRIAGIGSSAGAISKIAGKVLGGKATSNETEASESADNGSEAREPGSKIYKLLDFAGKDRSIADPWYTGNFDLTYDDVVEGCEALLNILKNKMIV